MVKGRLNVKGRMHKDADNWQRLISFLAEYTDQAELKLDVSPYMQVRFIRIEHEVTAHVTRFR